MFAKVRRVRIAAAASTLSERCALPKPVERLKLRQRAVGPPPSALPGTRRATALCAFGNARPATHAARRRRPRPKKGEDWHLNKLSVTLCFTYCSCCKRAVLQRSACPHSVSACAVKPLARADVMSPLFALVDLSSPKTLQTRRAVEAEVSVRVGRFLEPKKNRAGFAAVELDLLPRGSGCLVLPRAETAYFISASRTL